MKSQGSHRGLGSKPSVYIDLADLVEMTAWRLALRFLATK
jgi:hypothetical protein